MRVIHRKCGSAKLKFSNEFRLSGSERIRSRKRREHKLQQKCAYPAQCCVCVYVCVYACVWVKSFLCRQIAVVAQVAFDIYKLCLLYAEFVLPVFGAHFLLLFFLFSFLRSFYFSSRFQANSHEFLLFFVCAIVLA